MLNSLWGCLGILVQVTIFALVALSTWNRSGRARALLYGGVFAVYGYGLIVTVAMLLAVPWQVANLVLAGAIGLVFTSSRARTAVRMAWPELLFAARRGWGAVAIIGVLVAFHSLVAVLKPELSIDGQLYHGPVLAMLVQSGSLWGWTPTNEYVYYTDLTMSGGVNLATFTGVARFDDALQIPHLVLLVLAVNFALDSRFAKAWIRVAFGALIVSAPVIWMQARILYVDLAYGAAVAIAVLLIVLTKRFGVLDILVTATAIAAILATKPAGILTSGLLLAVFIVVAVWRRRRAGARVGPSIAVVAGVALIPGIAALSFYVRNGLSFSNPVYPVKASFGPVTLPGIVDLSVFASGERGSGFVDPGRVVSFLRNIASGMLHGVVKVDYDPRSGGFGLVPLFVAALVVLILVAQLVLRARGEKQRIVLPFWRAQVWMVVLSVAILLIQPATFDSRYVIGPLVVLLVALLLTTLVAVAPLIVDVCAAAVALGLAVGQAAWTEVNVYPGLNTIRELRSLGSEQQPGTPGNPWGRASDIAWLPQNPAGCLTIAVQTRGGVGPEGMLETSFWGTLPYALYGEALCNRVVPIVADRDSRGRANTRDGLEGADFALLYRDDLDEWELPGGEDCWVEVSEIKAADPYTSSVTVMRNTCS